MSPRALPPLTLASLLALTSCAGGTHYSYANVTLIINPQVSSVQAGSTQTFNATTTDAPNYPVWTLNGSIATSSSPAVSAIGSFVTPTTDAPTGTYTAPTTPPIYNAAQVAAGQKQGTVTLGAFVSNSDTKLFSDVFASTTFAIVGPISVGLSPATGTIKLGSTLSFTAYVVGTLSDGYTFKVNGFSGGGSDVGTISTTGLYTAPAIMPMTGSSVTVTAVSTADTTKTASAIITLQ